MLFSVTQQVVSQDLRHWMIYVAARPEHNPQLISTHITRSMSTNKMRAQHSDILIEILMTMWQPAEARK